MRKIVPLALVAAFLAAMPLAAGTAESARLLLAASKLVTASETLVAGLESAVSPADAYRVLDAFGTALSTYSFAEAELAKRDPDWSKGNNPRSAYGLDAILATAESAWIRAAAGALRFADDAVVAKELKRVDLLARQVFRVDSWTAAGLLDGVRTRLRSFVEAVYVFVAEATTARTPAEAASAINRLADAFVAVKVAMEEIEEQLGSIDVDFDKPPEELAAIFAEMKACVDLIQTATDALSKFMDDPLVMEAMSRLFETLSS